MQSNRQLRIRVRIPNHKQILSVILLGSLRKIEGPGNYSLPIDDHHLIVCYHVPDILLFPNRLFIAEISK